MSETLFEWDNNKAAKNLRKHPVSFAEAATAFDDPMFITFVDEEHFDDEKRYITLGLSKAAAATRLATRTPA